MKCCGIIFQPSLDEATLCQLIIIQLTDGLIIVLEFWTKTSFYKPVHVGVLHGL